MERMSTLDAGFFLVDHTNVPMHLGLVATFSGPAPSLAQLAGLYEERLGRLRRYRQRVRTSPMHLHRPAWEDEPRFDIRQHLKMATVPSPGDAAQLSAVAARIFEQPLDLAKAPWEAWLLEGLADGNWAVLSKVHHCTVDGIGGSDLMVAIFGTEADESPDCDARQPTSAPCSGWTELATWPLRQFGSATAAATGLGVRTMTSVPAYARGLARAARRLAAPSASSLNGPASTHRSWTWTTADLSAVRQIRSALGGTINDVLLTAIAGSFRGVLPAAELCPDLVVRSLMPVSIRADGERGTATNRLSAVLVNLPIGEPDPARRLRLIRSQTEDLKSTHQAAGPELLTAMLRATAPPLLAAGLRIAFRLPQPLVQAVTTNVPGPRQQLSALGRPMLAAYPFVGIGGNVRVSVAIYSYQGTLSFGLTVDPGAGLDLAQLASGIDCELAQLTRLADVRQPHASSIAVPVSAA